MNTRRGFLSKMAAGLAGLFGLGTARPSPPERKLHEGLAYRTFEVPWHEAHELTRQLMGSPLELWPATSWECPIPGLYCREVKWEPVEHTLADDVPRSMVTAEFGPLPTIAMDKA